MAAGRLRWSLTAYSAQVTRSCEFPGALVSVCEDLLEQWPDARDVLVDQGEVKAVDVSYVDEEADLALMITFRDTSSQAATAAEMATIPESALAEFDQILDSFGTQ